MLVITGASGHLGRLTIDALLGTVPAERIVAAVRNPARAADLAARGVRVREADYDRPETLPAALEGARRVLLISSSEIGRRFPHHQAVVDAASQTGVELLAYTSLLRADTTPLALAPEHKATETYIRESGLTFSFLRNGWYTENYVQAISHALQTGVIVGSARDGRISSAARADYAEAAAAVLTGDGHQNTVYELAGDVAWSLPELAATVTRLSGASVTYQDLPVDQYAKILEGAGMPAPMATIFSQVDVGIADGWLEDNSGTLSRLIGRPTTPLQTSLSAVISD